MRRKSTLIITLLAGCNSLLGIHDPARTDGPVAGTWIDGHITMSGTASIAMDLSAWDISAYVADVDQPSGFAVVPATVTGPGTFEFPDLPASYLLRIQPRDRLQDPRFFQATSRTLDLGRELAGRPDLEDTRGGMALSFDIPGPIPYWSTDVISLYSLGAAGSTPGGTDGFTLYKGFRGIRYWIGGVYDPYLKRLAGDDLWVIHSRGATNNAPPQILEAARFDGVTLTDDATVPISGGTFVRAPEPKGIPVAPAGDYRVALGAGPERGPYDHFGLTIHASPGHGTDAPTYIRWVGLSVTVPGPVVYSTSRFSGTTLEDHEQVWFNSPFPPDWQPVVIDSYQIIQRSILVPGTIGWATIGGEIASVRPLGSTIAFGPMISAPRNIQIDGASGDRVIAPHPIVIRWDPVTGASYYTITMESIERAPMSTQSWLVPVTRLHTADTSITLPGDLLVTDHRYVFHVAAIVDDSGYRDGVLQHPGRPYGLASAISGIVLASATCGNGRLDPGEDCDTGGASATCDADCTSPVCSDGVFNPAAGEVCDFGLGDPTCNLSCNGPPVCGDGKYDWFTEQCDDGNTVNGDGCSSTCQPENLCGNGRVDRVTIYEECDDGNRIDDDGCSNTCRLPYCGDGMLQSARSESCDDGNMISGDGCDSHCQIEPPPA